MTAHLHARDHVVPIPPDVPADALANPELRAVACVVCGDAWIEAGPPVWRESSGPYKGRRQALDTIDETPRETP